MDLGPGLRARRLTLTVSMCACILALAFSGDARAAAPLSIAVSGNHFVNGANQTIRLLGVDQPSTEYACAQGWGYDDGEFTAADAAAIAAWHANAVRVPINEDCWLGINGQPSYGSQAGYQQEIENYVADLNADGIYAILDLHWSAPGTEVALEQQPMPDADHSVAFWSSMASTFKSDPGVVFDLFNEPFDPNDPRSGSSGPGDAVSWACWDNGGCSTVAYDEDGPTNTTYQVAGMQQLVTAIRNAGATQPVMLGGLNYANDLSGWLANRPVDPLSQEAASFHNYQGQACSDAACWNSQVAPVAAQVPVVTGEFDEDDFDETNCDEASSTFDDDYMNWADQNGVSYLAWGWYVLDQSELDGEGCSAYALISDAGGTPLAPDGTALYDHLAALAAAPAPPVGGSSGTSPTSAPAPTTTPAPSPPRTDKPAVGQSLRRLRIRLIDHGRTLRITLTARHIATATITVSTASGHGVRLALATAHLKAGRSASVTFKLDRAARKSLKAHPKLKLRLTVVLAGAGHARTTVRRTVRA